MSSIDKRALREAAKAVGKNDWEYVYTSDLSAPGRGYITVGGAEAIYCLNKAAGGVKQSENVLRYIAAANPATFLALLDELDAKETENERMALELLNRSGEIEGLRQRIAELESREINLPPYSFFDFKQGSPFKSGAYCHIDSVNKELSKHCIKMIAAAGKGEAS
ncbi:MULTISPECIES: ead/Ea22-like family protein [Enterobacter]|uniref:ead/Ea22-like family protein n=1 Tax=Enterobacter TaxID=547 RepID=UPI0007356CAC|nr:MULTISPECIES: ead/Ea22-like family protein [Enterobacter]MCM7750301.1 ead/Ea22-like family protein [Enterobacter hormaechei]KTJ98639.1 hypothetical protein ASU71_08320 [Enterobacter hormaechei subsp. hoffmannii]MCM7844013.1 ead/Ea22-like family protein [Enterobacter hormaechei]MCM7936550.1 ead/Ea22-like family protein [Enterobacter hormaechei]HAS1764215.1 ead/Ea22-like family protein [Enterobacter hormaechei subsp. hoffmannii]